MMLWAFSTLPDLTLASKLLQASRAAGQRLDGLSLSGMFMAFQQRHMHQHCAALVQANLAKGSMFAVAASMSAARLAESGDATGALELLQSAATGGLNAASQQVWIACGGCVKSMPPCSDDRFPDLGEPYAKELRLLQHVLTTAERGNVESVCAAVESFGEGMLPGTSRWLKVAGGQKSKVLVDAANQAPMGGVVVEVGTYIGYSAAKFARTRAARTAGGNCAIPSCPSVVTIEVDLAHAVIAHNLLMFAGVAHMVEVLVGHSEEVLPWLASRMREHRNGRPIVDLLFLDQRGSRYSADLAVLEHAGSLKEGAKVVADNVLKPGAPLFLWQVSRGGRFSTEVRSLAEFAMAEVEDWMTVSTYSRNFEAEEADTPSPAPLEILMLEWKAEQMRAKTHQPDHGGSGVGFSEWAEFAEEMRVGMQLAGLASGVPRLGRDEPAVSSQVVSDKSEQ